MLSKRNDKLFVTDGTVIGRLTVGDLVRFVRDHILYPETPISYLRQGRLREVHCECGTVRLVSESILATGRLQSCGCLRYEMRNQAQQDKITRMEKESQRRQVILDIKIAQAKLKQLQFVRVPMRDEKAIEECGALLRKLFARKGQLNRKESHKEVGKRVKEVWQRKLLQDPESDNYRP